MDVALIIPVRDDEKNLNEILLAINDQSYLPNEILIVDSSTNKEV